MTQVQISIIQKNIGFADLGHAGFDLSASLTALFSILIEILYLKKINITLFFPSIAIVFGKVLLASSLMGLIIIILKSIILNQALLLLTAVPLGIAVYLLTIRLFLLEESAQVTKFITEVIAKTK